MCLFSWYPHLAREAGPTITHSRGEWTVSERAIGLSVISRLPNVLSESEYGLVAIPFTKAMLPFQHVLDGWTPRPRLEYLQRRAIWMHDIVRERDWRRKKPRDKASQDRAWRSQAERAHRSPQKMMWTGLNGYTTQYKKTKGQDEHRHLLPIWSAHWFKPTGQCPTEMNRQTAQTLGRRYFIF